MTLIAQAYVHNKNMPLPSQLEVWWIIAQKIAYEEALRVYGTNIEVEISFEIGSLKTRVKVLLGALLGIYGFVATYPDFKDGLNQMIRDAKDFAGSFNEEFISETQIKNEEIISRQRKKETPGRILRALESLENYERRGRIARPDQLELILQQLTQALGDLEPHDQWIVAELLQKRFPYLPLPRILGSRSILRPMDEHEIYQMMEEADIRKYIVARLRTDRPLKSQLMLTTQRAKDN